MQDICKILSTEVHTSYFTSLLDPLSIPTITTDDNTYEAVAL